MKEPTFDRDGFPTDQTLGFIESFDCSSLRNRQWMLSDFARAAWNKSTGHWRVLSDGNIRVNTGGDPRNEEVVDAMIRNIELRIWCYVSSERGGVYTWNRNRL